MGKFRKILITLLQKQRKQMLNLATNRLKNSHMIKLKMIPYTVTLPLLYYILLKRNSQIYCMEISTMHYGFAKFNGRDFARFRHRFSCRYSIVYVNIQLLWKIDQSPFQQRSKQFLRFY